MSLIKPTRRDLLRLAAVAPAFAMPSAARAAVLTPSGAGNPAHFRFDLGAAKVTIVSDGYFTIPMSGQAMNASEEEKLAFLAAHYQDSEVGYSHTNHLYVEIGEAKVLVDVGSGSRFAETAGRLMENLEAAGIDPYAITHVVLTHAHPDHIWGIRDDFDEPIFPDAEYIIGADEYAWWMQDGLVDRVEPAMQQMVVGAVNSLTADGLEWTMAADGQEVVPGVRLVATPGHTPGHMSVMVESDGQSLIALGDAMSSTWLNFAHPEWFNGFDHDGDMTVQTRLRLMDMVATDRIAVLGYHFPFPGVGHVARRGDAFEFVPALWQF
ncbi:MBL fold metallo-hydrolase [Aliiroseovarius subalbicans]|uniref:MBL fold metallo-hydrolase n=1 Tax=Aliiroseovarius subalbicans TaxID=2925840 RepID=UPI001F599B6A|nr:MBL fold metallo-hydrolase [Aliiroseovarius subalbicans]MCI2398573.1 MBL fold metallo-hydrolase [Aliiroseovarius subalbicans]